MRLTAPQVYDWTTYAKWQDSDDGEVIEFPIDEAQADAVSIVHWLNVMAVGFGRNPRIRDYAELVLPTFLGNNDLAGVIDSLLSFVKDNLTYMPDPEGTEYVVSPLVLFKRILFQGKAYGDCDDHSLLLAAPLRSFGIDARIIGVKESVISEWFDHVIVATANGNGGLRYLDPCAKVAAQPCWATAEQLIID